MAAPTATTSSGLTPRCGSRPKKFFTVSMIFGMRVMPPTRMTSLISEDLSPASLSEERQVHLRLHRARELDLRLLRRFLEALQGKAILAQVDAVLFFELIGKVVD